MAMHAYMRCTAYMRMMWSRKQAAPTFAVQLLGTLSLDTESCGVWQGGASVGGGRPSSRPMTSFAVASRRRRRSLSLRPFSYSRTRFDISRRTLRYLHGGSGYRGAGYAWR